MNADKNKKTKFKLNANYIRIPVIILLALTALFLVWMKTSGVQMNSGKDYTSISLYFRNAVTYGWEKEQHQIKNGSKGAMVEEVFKLLREGPRSPQLIKSIPDYVDTEAESILTEDKIIYISFSESYDQMTATEAADLNCSLVWSLTELDFIDNVHIYVADRNLIPDDENKNPVHLNRENVQIHSEIPDSLIRQKAVLYFPDEQGLGLVAETREIPIDSSHPVETAIINAMIEGPDIESLVRVIPKETKVISTKVDDISVICYVNLSSDFIDKLESASSTEQRLAVASIVNALTERTNIKKVQILIEGDKTAQTKGHGLDLSKPFERMETEILD